MSMANREKAELEPQQPSASSSQTVEIGQLMSLLEKVKSFQITADHKQDELNANFQKVNNNFVAISQQAANAIKEAKETATKIEPALLALTKELNAIRQKTDSFMDNQSVQLKKAVQDVENLERKMLTSFADVVSRTKPTFKERLYLVAVVAASSLTFSLLFTLLLHLLVFKKAS